ncbi:putative isomerase [Quercus suber]|uniref:Isomerase n=1 Tax=Quercus suber TaxID=58331 RepID=A0AAW0J7U4_QUESU
MAKLPVKYYVVDAFTGSAFKGNPAAVCLLEEERDEKWLQAVAAEFNIPETCYLIRLSGSDSLDSSNPRFRLRWFTPVAEVKICGHATLATAHTLFTSSLLNCDVIEFVTKSGTLTARKVADIQTIDGSNIQNHESQESFLIELDFPTIPMIDFNSAEFSPISKALNGVSMIDIKRTATEDDLIFDLISKCPGRGIIISGLAPLDSGFDYYYRFFCPKLRINEDHVCGSANCALALYWSKRLGKCDLVAYADPVTGSAHCALAPYWSKKLGKCDLVAYQASPRSGVLNIHLDEQNQRVLMRGKSVTIMEGSLLV